VIRSSATAPTEVNRRSWMRRAAWIWSGALLIVGLFAAGLGPPATHAQDHSNRPIRILVGAGAGGSLDVETRIIAQALRDVLHQDIVVEARPGGGGVVAGELVASAPPDGNTLFSYAGDLFTTASLMPAISFNPNTQLVPVAQMSSTPLAVVAGARAPFDDVKGLIAAAKASPQSFTYGTFAVASVNNVVGQWIAKEAHIKLLNVTYRSGAEAALAAAAGNVTLAIVSPAAVYPSLTNAGTVKVIGITSAERPSYLPASWQTFAQNGIPVDVAIYLGLFAPAATPNSIVDRLDRALSVVLDDETLRQRLAKVGIYPQYLGPAGFLSRVKTDKASYDRVITEMHMLDAQR
jgi:tripartite-type tricarboxylate transporter receptor subunit TctC